MQMDFGEDDEDAFMTPDEEDDLEVLQRQRESAQASASQAAVQADEWASESCTPQPCCMAGCPRGRVVPGGYDDLVQPANLAGALTALRSITHQCPNGACRPSTGQVSGARFFWLAHS